MDISAQHSGCASVESKANVSTLSKSFRCVPVGRIS